MKAKIKKIMKVIVDAFTPVWHYTPQHKNYKK